MLELESIQRQTWTTYNLGSWQVSRSENVKGTGIGKHNKIKTHCPKGHEYSIKNTLRIHNNYRQCLTCKRAFGRRYAAERRENERV